LTPALQGRRRASLTIHAEDDVRSGAQAKGKQSHMYDSVGWDYTRTTGIWQTVWLECVPQTYMASQRLTPDLKKNGLQVEVKLGGQAAPKGARLALNASFEGRPMGYVEVVCNSTSASAFVPLDETFAWTPEHPHLYDLTLSLIDNFGEQVDRVESYFGMRSVEINGYAVELNGKPYFQRLILDQGYYPDGIYTAPNEEALRRDIEISKGMGFNGARLHQKVFEPRFLYLCDKLGYLAWGETPDWGLDVTKADGLATMMTNWVEQIERDYSHPSIVGWMPFNEHDTRTNPESFRALYRMTRAMDPTRPCIDSSGWVHVETCIFDVHDYAQDPAVFEARYRPLLTGEGEVYRCLDLFPGNCNYKEGQPYFVSEFGGIWWNPGQAETDPAWGYGAFPKTEDEFLQRFKGLCEVLLQHPKMFGFCYTQLTDVEQEVNGLYYYDRTPKFDIDFIRSVVSQTAAIEEERGRVFTLPTAQPATMVPGEAERITA
jgi:beta-galactosidase/beta-glucuronidase